MLALHVGEVVGCIVGDIVGLAEVGDTVGDDDGVVVGEQVTWQHVP